MSFVLTSTLMEKRERSSLLSVVNEWPKPSGHNSLDRCGVPELTGKARDRELNGNTECYRPVGHSIKQSLGNKKMRPRSSSGSNPECQLPSLQHKLTRCLHSNGFEVPALVPLLASWESALGMPGYGGPPNPPTLIEKGEL